MKIKVELDALKKVHEKLVKKGEELEQEISEREDYVETKSEKWQESDKCVDYTNSNRSLVSLRIYVISSRLWSFD